MAYYIVAGDLRTELGLDSTQLTDAQANDVIENAEELIDQGLGAWPMNTAESASTVDGQGRKIDLLDPDIESWQIAKLQRATTKLAAQLYREPQLRQSGQYYSSISGPQFSFSGLVGTRISRDAISSLNASGLRRLGSHAKPRIKRQPKSPFFVD